MYVSDPLSLYTELYGWIFYGVIWDVIVASGLALLPIAFIVIGHLAKARENGSMMNNNGDSILSGLEVKLFITMLVILVAAVPSITVNAASFSYAQTASAFSDRAPAVVQSGNTGSTFDAAATSPAADATVQVPAFWYLVSAINHGITYAAKRSIDDKGQAYTAVKRSIELLNAPTPQIQEHLQRFNNECYAKALLAYDEDRKLANTLWDPVGGNANVNGADVSHMAYEDIAPYYETIRTTYPVQGTVYVAADNVANSQAQTWGKPFCSNYLESIVTQIKTDPHYVEANTMLTRAFGLMDVVFTDATLESQSIHTYMEAGRPAFVSEADEVVTSANADKSPLFQDVTTALGAKHLLKMVVATEAFTDGLIYALFQTRSIVMMTLVMLLPVGMVLSMYKPEFLLQASVLLFAVTFLSVLWSLAAWAQTTLAVSLMPSLDEIMNSRTWFGPLKKRLALNMSSIMFYTVVPIAMFSMLSSAGFRAAASVGMAMGGGGAGAGQTGRTAGMKKAGAATKAAVGRMRR